MGTTIDTNLRPLVVIVGETASGKSAMSLELASLFNGEIVCADSWTVYKGFDIGTAKPTAEEQVLIPHHLLDIADPAEGFSVVEFKKRAQVAINDIHNRGKTPFLVGGSGLYVDAILYDYQFLPAGQPGQRQELNSLSLEELQAMVQQLGISTEGIDTRNKRRLIRLIETGGKQPQKSPLRPNTMILRLQLPPETLENRIITRIDQMVENGFVDEVKNLGKQYGWDCQAMNAPGYRAFRGYVEGRLTLEEAKADFMRNDLKLAKKQRTWFKRNSSIQAVSDPSESVELLTTFLNKTT